jgi:hypothetical protein
MDLWLFREREEHQLRRVEILFQQFPKGPRGAYTEEEGPVQISNRLALSIKKKDAKAIKEEIKNCIVLNKAIKETDELSEVINSPGIFWIEPLIRMSIPLKLVPLNYRQTVLALIICDSLEILRFFCYPAPTNLLAPKTNSEYVYGRLNGKQHAKARKNARFDGAML